MAVVKIFTHYHQSAIIIIIVTFLFCGTHTSVYVLECVPKTDHNEIFLFIQGLNAFILLLLTFALGFFFSLISKFPFCPSPEIKREKIRESFLFILFGFRYHFHSHSKSHFPFRFVRLQFLGSALREQRKRKWIFLQFLYIVIKYTNPSCS